MVDGGVTPLARLVTGAGLVTAAGGAIAWLTARHQLAGERIQIPESAGWLPGRTVKGPLTAFAEAEAIRSAASAATGGRTYAELGESEPVAEVAMNASLLRSSLFTSVLAFGISGGLVGLGGILMLIGSALARLSRSH